MQLIIDSSWGWREPLTIHSPDLDLPVISSRHNERHAGVEGGPIDPTVMTLDKKGQVTRTQMKMMMSLVFSTEAEDQRLSSQ